MKITTTFGSRTWQQLKHLLAAPAGVLLLCLLAANSQAQIYTILHTFTAPAGSGGYAGTNSDGACPFLGLLLSGNTLYGAAAIGGSSGAGTLFAVNTNGTGFTNFYSFTPTSGTNGSYYYSAGTNCDGAVPNGGLILSGNTLYGTAQAGGSAGCGTLFAVNTNGTGFTTLYSFTATAGTNGGFGTNSDGAYPFAGLLLSSNTLYGTTQFGGNAGLGTVFAVNTDGTAFTNLHIFSATSGTNGGMGVNSDGVNPVGGLILSGNTLYGTAIQGGSSGWGTVFGVNTDGTGFRTLHSFTTPTGSTGGYGINSDGGWPWDALVLSGDTLYGTTAVCGSSGYGTVFAVNTNGTGFRTVHSFNAGAGGSNPHAGLISTGNTLYGTTYRGFGYGGVFAINTNGTGFTSLHSFAGRPSDGANPSAGLTLSGTTLYGTTFYGGTSSAGTVFSLSYPAPQLTITPSGPNVNLKWPSAVAGFSYSGCTLQFTTDLGPSAVWCPVSCTNVIVSGQNTVTNPMIGPQMFFRLCQ